MIINRRGTRWFLGLALMICLLIATPAGVVAESGTTYYVAPGGNDTWPGTETQPWASIDHAATIMQAGDTVLIRGGEYHERVETRYSGSVGAPITFQAYPGETPTLDGAGAGGNNGFNIAGGHSYIRVSGLHIRNFAGYGLVLWGNNQHVEIAGVEISANGVGMRLTEYGIPGGVVERLLIDNSQIHDNRLSGINCAPGPCRDVQVTDTVLADNGEIGQTLADGFSVETGEGIDIARCIARGNTGDGFDIKASQTDVSRSLAWGNANDGLKVWGDGVTLTNNISRDNLGAGLVLLSGGAYTATHNTVAHNAVDISGYGVCVACDASAETDARMFNNIFAFNGGPVYFGDQVTLEADHNMYYSRIDLEIRAEFTLRGDFSRDDINYGLWFIETGNGYHSGAVDPLFVSNGQRDYHLQSDVISSPAIDSGSNAWGAAIDYDGVSRPQGQFVDIGAYEYVPALEPVFLPLIVR
jgi:hypothetical protein